MKKIKLLFLFSFCILVLYGCGKKEEIPEPTEEVTIEDIDVAVEKKLKQETISHEKTEVGKAFDEMASDLNEYYYYYPLLDNFTIYGKKAYTEKEVSEQFLLDEIVKQFSDKTCLVENFEKISPDEIISYKNGVPSVSYDGEFIGYLSLDGVFQEILNEQTTSLYQWFIIQSVSDIFCKNLQCEKIQILSGGVPISTLYKEYTPEDFVSFSTKIYDNFDVISEDEAILGRDVEKYILMGYTITQQDYLEILNNGKNLEGLNLEENTTEEIAIENGLYTMSESEINPPTISFNLNDSTFQFTFDILSSYLNIGTFSIEENKIICTTEDGNYNFIFEIIDKHNISFISNESSDVKTVEGLISVVNGAIFTNGTIEDISSQEPETIQAEDIKEENNEDEIEIIE